MGVEKEEFLTSISLLCQFWKQKLPYCQLLHLDSSNSRFLHFYIWIQATPGSSKVILNTFTAGLNQTVCTKTTRLHVVLHARNLGVESSRELFKGSKDVTSLLVCTWKKFLVEGYGFFVSDVISGGLLGQHGPLYLALGSKFLKFTSGKPKNVFFSFFKCNCTFLRFIGMITQTFFTKSYLLA